MGNTEGVLFARTLTSQGESKAQKELDMLDNLTLNDVLVWSALGLVAGLLARHLMPGRAKGGLGQTIALGLVGALVGGFIGVQFNLGHVSGFNLTSIILSVGGAVLVLIIYSLLKGKNLP
jgi:uncharacterized membrane protein YeaQ/YmgE (transglycosylase-associated protein family)